MNDLKAQLAEQEIELTKKNEEADKLIEIVGIETEKVSKEKAIADEEELKVSSIKKSLKIEYLNKIEKFKRSSKLKSSSASLLRKLLAACTEFNDCYNVIINLF